MLPAMCSHPPCMNIEVKIVRKAGGWLQVLDRDAALPRPRGTRRVPSQTSDLRPATWSALALGTRSHSLPGWVIR